MGLKNLPVYLKLGLGFGIILLLLLIIGGISYLNSKSTLAHNQDVESINAIEKEMIKKEVDHLKFMEKATQFFLVPSVTTMQVETDDHKCGLGKWLFGEGRRTAAEKIPELVESLKRVERSHAQLHGSIIQINDLAAKADKQTIQAQAMKIFSNTTQPALEKVQSGLKDVGNILEQQSKKMSQDLAANMNGSKIIILSIVLGAFLVGILMSWFITRNLSGNIVKIIDANQKMVEGDMRVRVGLDQKDEMGILSGAANKLAEKLELILTQIRGNSSTMNISTSSLENLAEKMSSSSQITADNCSTVAAASEEMNTNMNAIAAASEQTSTNIDMVAAAAEELTSTITEIAANSENARQITLSAVEESQSASSSIHELGEAAKDINKVTETINEIAEQTNLLALNATIEAARAGEAGKGFAVVANEIKELAKQTTDATREIKNRIDGVQQSSGKTIKAINVITTTINSSSEVVSSMAQAVEEQASTTQEIAENVSQASIGMQEVNENIAQATMVNRDLTEDITRIQKEAEGVASVSSDISELATEMNTNTMQLKKMVNGFKVKEEAFNIGKVKAAHFNWKMRLTAVLKGHQILQVGEIPNHHQCDFGKWYDNAPERLTSLSVFKEIGVHHKAVHLKVAEAVEHYNNKNSTAAESSIREFEVVRKQLFEKLDEMYVS